MHDLLNILLDRDGTVIRENHYLSTPEYVQLLPGVAHSLQRLSHAGFHLFLVSNQSGIGRGYFSESDRKKVDQRLENMLVPYQVVFRGKLHCPHAPEDGCTCRKPRTGMWSVLQREFGLRAEQSLMVGDKMSDVAFGKNAGLAATALLLTGHGSDEARNLGIPEPDGPWREERESRAREWPDIVARDLNAFCAWLLQG